MFDIGTDEQAVSNVVVHHLAGKWWLVEVIQLWIGRDGPIPWTPRSLDITHLDFFLWGCVKDIVYRTAIRGINELKQRTIDANAAIDEDVLQRTWQEIDYRLDVLNATNGAHTEVCYIRKTTKQTN